MCVVCALCVGLLVHSRTSAHLHLAGIALPTPMRCLTRFHRPTAPCVLRCTIRAFCVVPHCSVLCTTLHCVCPASLLLWAEGSRHCNALPRRLGAVGSGNPAAHLLQYIASLPGGSGQCNSFNALSQCLGAVGSGPPAIHYLTVWGQWQVDLHQYTAPLLGGSGQWTSCNTLPYCLGAAGSATPGVVWCGAGGGQEKNHPGRRNFNPLGGGGGMLRLKKKETQG